MSTPALRVERITTAIIDHPVRQDRVIVSPGGRHDTSRYLIVTVHGANEVVGYGEAATTTMWSGEVAEGAQWVVENLFAPALTGHSFDHPREVLSRLDKIIYGHPFAKSAVDTALWDLWARLQGVPVTKLFSDRESVATIPSRASVGTYDTAETLRIASEYWQEGIRTLKFKIGTPDFDDVARLRAVRDLLGDEPIFTVDANGAYQSADEAVAAIEALLPFNLALVEQPTPRDRIYLLAQVRRRVDIPIMADECIFTPGHLHDALECDAFDILSIYPGKNGGFSHALEMARTAQQAGKSCSIGSNGESDLGQAAMACLASGLSAFPVDKVACDFPAALMYERSSIREPLPMRGGRLEVPTGNGFGVEPLPS